MNNLLEALKSKKRANVLFIGGIAFAEIVLIVFILLNTLKGIWDGTSVFSIVALDLILLWVGLLIAFYAWAIYFYNINLGLTNESWAKIKEEKDKIEELEELGEDTSQMEHPSYPEENPYGNQSLGLPPGTIRGTLALTLLIGGFSLFIFSMGDNSQIYEGDSFIYDSFDFFKTAFLMMIAFYFGTRSLEILQKNHKGIIQKRFGKQQNGNGNDGGGSETTGSSDITKDTIKTNLPKPPFKTTAASPLLKRAILSVQPQEEQIEEEEVIENADNEVSSLYLSREEIINKAEENGIEPAVLMAVLEIESGKSGFLEDGRPKILFEGHIFWRLLKQKHKEGKIDFVPEKFAAEHPDILYPKWTRKYYKGAARQYERLEKAMLIEHDSALMSASWGKFQILGENYRLAGFKSVDAFVEAQKISESNQLDAFFNYCKNRKYKTKPLIEYLKIKNWQTFARAYNGPGYEANQYDLKLEQAYTKYARSLNQNIKAVLKREEAYKSKKVQTLGELTVFDGDEVIFTCKTLELPWKDNKKNISCIPEGNYEVKKRYSERYKHHFHILNVPDRSFILIHSGNYYTHTQGCILVGETHTDINADGFRDVTSSRKTIALLNQNLPDNFEINISENA